MSKEFDLAGWDDEEASDAAATSLTLTETRADEVRQASSEQQLAERIRAAVDAARPGLDKIPDPVDPASDGELSPEEEERRDACVAGIELLSTACWVAGKSLDTMAVGRLFRTTPHKLDPDRTYTTIEDWAWTEHGINQTTASKLRAGWQLGEVLNARGYKAPEGQVRELIPLQNKHGLKAAVGLYEIVVQTVGASKVTAGRLRDAVKLLPGDLELSDDDESGVIAKTLTGILTSAELPAPKPTTALPAALRRDVDRRAVALADKLDRGRLPRNELLFHLLEAFADDQDTRVFDAVLERVRKSSTSI
jgi:hypothetical protein